MNRRFRLLTIPALLWGISTPVSAQTPNPNDAGFAQPPPPEEESSGDPLYGYLAFAFFASVAIFAVTKSSRRS